MRPEQSTFSLVTVLLTQLSAEELKAVRHRAGFLLGLGGLVSPSTGSSADADPLGWVMEGITGELRRRGLLGIDSRLPPKLVQQHSGASSAAEQHLMKRCVRPLSAPERMALGALVARALADYILSWSEPPPLGPQVMLRNLDKVPTALDAAFPGYLEAGLIHMLVCRPSIARKRLHLRS